MPRKGEKVRRFIGNLRARRPFSPHENETSILFLMRADGDVRRGERASPACASDATGSDGSACARARKRLLTNATGAAARHRCARGHHNRPAGRSARRQTGEIRRVLCPPTGVDPEIRAPTPDAGNTPVIPPPGSPGRDPTVRPK